MFKQQKGKGGRGMKGWQKNVLLVVVAAIIGFVMYSAAGFFGLLKAKDIQK